MALAGSRIPIPWYGWTCYTLRFTSLPLRDFRAGQPFLSVFGKSYPQTAAIDSAGKRFLVYHNLYNSCDRSWCNYLSLRRISDRYDSDIITATNPVFNKIPEACERIATSTVKVGMLLSNIRARESAEKSSGVG